MPRDECMGNLMLSVSTDSDCVRGPRDWGLTNHFCKYQPSNIQHAVQWLHVNFHTVLTFCESLSLKISSSPIMIKKKNNNNRQTKQSWSSAKIRGSHGLVVWGWRAMKIAVQTAGKAPVNSGPAWWTHSCSSSSCCSSVTLTMGFLAALHNFFCCGSVCGPKDGKQAYSMFSWGPKGVEDLREEILSKCHVCLAWQQQWHESYVTQVLFTDLSLEKKKKLKEIQHFDPAVMSHIVAKRLHQTKPNKIFSSVINPETHGVSRASYSFDFSLRLNI